MDDTAALVARLEALETRIAYQDHTIEELNETITRQWKEIDGLRRDVARLADQVAEMPQRGAGEPDPPPPHY